jgi:alcohol dehydrogenase
LVTDQGLVKAGVAEQVSQVLLQAKVPFEVFDQVLPDPPYTCVDQGVAKAKETGCEAVIALGGGSAIDAAKCIALGLVDSTPLRVFDDGQDVTKPIAPLYAIPTTAGTGSEVTRGAVISDTERKLKMSIRGEPMLPLASILDPELLSGLPSRIAAESGADALVHAVEAYITREANPISDSLAEAAIRMIGQNLRPFTADPGNTSAAQNMLLASCMAGQAFTNAGLGIVHSLAEPAGSHMHVPHGLCCAMYLPPVMEFNLIACPERFARIAELLGENIAGLPVHQTAKDAVMAVEELFADCGLPATFAEAGIEFELHDDMVDQVMTFSTTRANPRLASREDIVDLFNSVA